MVDQMIRMYGTAWCGDCARARRFFDAQNIQYEYIDINADKEGVKVVEQHNNGNHSVPTIIYPDGTVLVEPSNSELTAKMTST